MTLSRQQKITTILLALCWPALFVFTHIPIPQVIRRAGVSDKSLHFLAYLILAFLLWFAAGAGKRVNWRKTTPWWVLLIILAYGILDEWSQGYVAGRSSDILDFVADLAGTITGLILFSVFTFWPAGLLVTAAVIFVMTNVAQKNLAELLPVASAAFHLFAYAIFTMLWVQCIDLFSPGTRPRRTKAKWVKAALAGPVVLLLTVKLFSVILGKEFALPDMAISIGAIVAVVAAICLSAPFNKTQDLQGQNSGP
ncbi:MAG: hypothetical protein CEE38_10080 [Planctomycetes bacterium B3_Pla]|nr:MAG: hypothetical protein CEE38_10080 [Planctomycetes bacterium B3_Pla]